MILDKLNLNEEDRDNIADDAARQTNKLYGEFLEKWKLLNNLIFHQLEIVEIDELEIVRTYKNNSSIVAKYARQYDIISQNTSDELKELRKYRNQISHEISNLLKTGNVEVWLTKLDDILNRIKELSEPTTNNFSRYIRFKFSAASKRGEKSIELTSKNVHNKTTGQSYTLNNRMPACCNAMRKEMTKKDAITSENKKDHAYFSIKYELPKKLLK
jgi:hypothetical protein